MVRPIFYYSCGSFFIAKIVAALNRIPITMIIGTKAVALMSPEINSIAIKTKSIICMAVSINKAFFLFIFFRF